MSEKRQYTPQDVAAAIDHTQLKPQETRAAIEKLCAEARQYHFGAVCVNGTWVLLAKKLLEGSGVKVASVIGFPLGAMSTKAKAFEAKDAVENGADEIDMVMNIGAHKGGEYDYVRDDIAAVVNAVPGTPVKVILETGYLTDDEIVKASQLVKEAGAAFVKTSTGFGPSGASVPHVELMRKTVGPQMGVKAAGGIRSYEDAVKMLNAGATRLGTSSGAAIVQGATSQESY